MNESKFSQVVANHTADEPFIKVGKALAAWQPIEHALMNICCCACVTGNASAFSALFHQTSGFKARVNMTSSAMEYSKASERLKGIWKNLAAELSSAGGKRNKIVHGTLGIVTSSDQPNQWFVFKNFMDPKVYAKGTFDGFGVSMEEVVLNTDLFSKLHQRVRKFEFALLAELDYSSDPQIPGRVQLDPEHRDRMAKEFRDLSEGLA